MGRKRSRSRSRQPSAPPARRWRRRTPTRTWRSRSQPKETPVRGKTTVPAEARRTGMPRRPGPPLSKPNKETPALREAMARKRTRSRSPEPPPQPVGRLWLPRIGILAARRTGRLRGAGQAVRWLSSVVPRPGTPPPSERAAFRASPSPEPAEEDTAATTSPERERALYLITQAHGHGVVSYYAVHRVDLAGSRHGISVSGEEFGEPPVARFVAAPGMSFFKAGSSTSSKKIVGFTGKDAGESVVIDAGTWEVSTGGPPPSSTEHRIVQVSGKIYAVEMLTEDPRCEVLLSATDAAGAGWSPLPRPLFRDRIVTLAAHPPRRGLLVSTDKGETFLLDGRRRRGGAAWVTLPSEAERAAYAKDHGLWFEVSPADGRLRAHDLAAVVLGAGAPKLEHAAHLVADPIPVIAPTTRGVAARSTKLVYLGSGRFCLVQATAERDGATGDGAAVTVTVFRVIDSGTPVTPAGRRRRRRERGMNARWVAAELERACTDEAAASGRRRKLCRVNLWSRTYIARGGYSHGPSLAGVLWM